MSVGQLLKFRAASPTLRTVEEVANSFMFVELPSVPMAPEFAMVITIGT